MNTFPLTITCDDTHTSFCLSSEEVTQSYGTLRFKYCGKCYVCDCDYLNVCSSLDSTLFICAVLDLTTYLNLHREIFGD